MEFIATKQRMKSRIPWETLAVREKCADVKTASKCNRKNPTNTNGCTTWTLTKRLPGKLKNIKLANDQAETLLHSLERAAASIGLQLTNIYLEEQSEYIQNQIDKIRDSVEDRKTRIAWQTINEVSRVLPKLN